MMPGEGFDLNVIQSLSHSTTAHLDTFTVVHSRWAVMIIAAATRRLRVAPCPALSGGLG